MWTMGAVCTKWHDAIHTKMREWGVLTYVSTLGKGFGKLPGYFDMPTWLCMVPDGWYGSNLCIVDSCNYRLAIMATSGECLRTVGRPRDPDPSVQRDARSSDEPPDPTSDS